MSQIEILIVAQVVFFVVAIIIFLALLLRRQMKTVARLKSLLTEYEEDASGETLVKHLQLAIDDTTAHCAQETINLQPGGSAEDQAISLRYAALTYELRFLQSNNGESTPWRTLIQPYTELATIYYDHIQSIPEKERVKFKGQMADMDKEQRRLEDETKRLLGELKKLSPIQDFFKQGFDEESPKNDIELGLHNALVSLCDTIDHAEGLREVIYLLHEAYYEKGNTPSESTTIETTASSEPATEPATEPSTEPSTEPGKHTVALNNIITEQNKLIHNLRTQLSNSEELEGSSEMTAHLDVLEQNFQAAQAQIAKLEEQLKNAVENIDTTSSDNPEDDGYEYSQDEMFELIEQFTEESAEMVERLHMLQNQNKLYIKENDELREQLSSTEGSDPDEPLPESSAKMQLASKDSEILQLQQAFKDVEEKYLALYEETMADIVSPQGQSDADSSEPTAQADTTPPTSEESATEDSSDAEDKPDIDDIDDIIANANI